MEASSVKGRSDGKFTWQDSNARKMVENAKWKFAEI